MKCASCYAENPPWVTVCSSCGGPAQPLEFCPNGHLLPPGVRECSLCATAWPEIEPFDGPPILRGVLWAERGRIRAAAAPAEGPPVGRGKPGPARRGWSAEYIELRDGQAPLSLGGDSGALVDLLADEDPRAACRVLVRPSGILVCRKAGASGRPGPLAYEPLAAGSVLDLGQARLRCYAFQPRAHLTEGGAAG